MLTRVVFDSGSVMFSCGGGGVHGNGVNICILRMKEFCELMIAEGKSTRTGVIIITLMECRMCERVDSHNPEIPRQIGWRN